MRDQDAKDQIGFIKQVIEDSMGLLTENGAYYTLWGVLIVLGTAATFAAHRLSRTHALLWIWLAVYVLGAAGVILLNRRHARNRPRTLARRVYASVWMAIGVSGVVFGACAILTGKIPLEVGFSLIAGLLGIAYFINSAMNRNRWMAGFSFGWWAGAGALFFVSTEAAPLVLCGLVLVLELVPGIVLLTRRGAHGGT
jgi:hypothetical protein